MGPARDQMSHAVFQGSRGVLSSRCRDDDIPRHVREEVVEGVSLPLTVLRVLKEVSHERYPEENRKPVRAVVLQHIQIGVQEGCQLFLLELLLKLLRGPRDLPMMVDGPPDLDLAARSEDRIASPPVPPGFDVFVPADTGDRLGGSPGPRGLDAPWPATSRSRTP